MEQMIGTVFTVMTYILIAVGLITCIVAAIRSGDPRSRFYMGDKVVCPWEKEQKAKAKAEEERRRNKQWWEA